MGKFGLSVLKHADDLITHYKTTVLQISSLLNIIKSSPLNNKTLYYLDEISNLCSITADTSQAISDLFPSPDWKKSSFYVQDQMFEVFNTLNHDVSILNILKSLKTSAEWSNFTLSQKYFTDCLIRDLVKEGITQESSNSLEIHRLQSQFLQNIRNQKVAVEVLFNEMESIPSDFRPERPGDVYAPCTIVNLSKSELVSSLNVCKNPSLRPKLFDGVSNYCPDNEKVLTELLTRRQNLAKDLGYNNFAAYTLNYQSFPIAPTDLITRLQSCWTSLKTELDNEFALLLDKKALSEQVSRQNPVKLHPSDVSYYMRKHLDSQLQDNFPNYNSYHSIQNYFTVYNVLEGISRLFGVLFQLKMVIQPCPIEESWSNNILKLTLQQNSENIGYLYLDLFQRPNKQNNPAAKYNIKCSRSVNMISQIRQLPIVVVSCNFSKQESDSTSLYWTLDDYKQQGLSFQNLQELYHELGHAMHSLLSDNEFQTYSGTRVPIDLAELPSHIFEHFITDYTFIQSWAVHKSSNTPLTESLFSYISSQDKTFQAFSHHVQISIAMFDLLLHIHSSIDAAKEEFGRLIKCDELQGRWYCGVEHFVEYASCYYSYILDKALSNVVWETVFQKKSFNDKAGEVIRNGLLKKGGSVAPQEQINEIFKPFLIEGEEEKQDVDPFYVMEYWFKKRFNNSQLIDIRKLRAENKKLYK